MKYSIYFALIVCFYAFSLCTPSKKEDATDATAKVAEESVDAASSFENGGKVYKLYCLMCHGEDGTMQQTGDYNLATSSLDLEVIIEVTREGRTTMMPYKTILSEQDLKDVSEYTLSLQQK